MKILSSTIFDFINGFLAFIQEKTDKLRQNSFLLSNIDIFILISILATFALSTFAQTGLIGFVSFFVPFFVVIKVIITKGEKIEIEKCNFYLLIYLFLCLISNFTSSMPTQSFYGFMKTCTYFAFYFALCQFLKNNKKYIMLLIFFIAILIGAESIIGIAQNITGVEVSSTWQDTSYVSPEHILSRVYGTLKPFNPNLYAAYLLVGLPALFAIFGIYLNKKNYKLAFCSLFFSAICILTIFLTGCRGAYLGLFVVFFTIFLVSFYVVFFELNNVKIKKYWKYITTMCVSFGTAFLLLNQSILKRILSIFIMRNDSSTSFRMNVYNSAIQMFQDNFLYGIGVGNKVFREIYGLYMVSGFDALSCYCIFLEIAVESGILALIAFIAFLFNIINVAYNKFKTLTDINYRILILCCVLSIIAMSVHGLFDTVFYRPQIQYIFWTIVACLVTLLKEE